MFLNCHLILNQMENVVGQTVLERWKIDYLLINLKSDCQ